jgi:hypothetical protein
MGSRFSALAKHRSRVETHDDEESASLEPFPEDGDEYSNDPAPGPLPAMQLLKWIWIRAEVHTFPSYRRIQSGGSFNDSKRDSKDVVAVR